MGENANTYRIEGPALISFSGGRTSAYMLHEIIRAHGGSLPDDVVVAFANTGKECEETLRFVHECGSRWGVRVRWVEYRDLRAAYQRKEVAVSWSFEEVGFNSASRNGEPFDALINRKGRLPNGEERWCTEFLKVKVLHRLMEALGYGKPGNYQEPIGLRHDEGHRILPGLARAETDGRRVCYPLANHGKTKRDVRGFWWGEGNRYETSTRPQGFDLELPDLWGNCDLFFAMGVATRRERVRQRPEVAAWWGAAEDRQGGTFSKRESVADLVRQAKDHAATPDLFDVDADCGTWCPGAAA